LNQNAAFDDLMDGNFTAYSNCAGSLGTAGTFGCGGGDDCNNPNPIVK